MTKIIDCKIIVDNCLEYPKHPVITTCTLEMCFFSIFNCDAIVGTINRYGLRVICYLLSWECIISMFVLCGPRETDGVIT